MAVGQLSLATKQALLARVISPRQRSPRRAASAVASMPPSDQPASQQSCGRRVSRSSSQSAVAALPNRGRAGTCTLSSYPSASANGCSTAPSSPQPGNRISVSRIGLYLRPALGQRVEQAFKLCIAVRSGQGYAQAGTARRYGRRTDGTDQQAAILEQGRQLEGASTVTDQNRLNRRRAVHQAQTNLGGTLTKTP